MAFSDGLIVIGYGFGDHCINNGILTFYDNGGKMLFINPNMPKFDDAFGFRGCASDRIIVGNMENVMWYKGTFKEASEDRRLLRVLSEYRSVRRSGKGPTADDTAVACHRQSRALVRSAHSLLFPRPASAGLRMKIVLRTAGRCK